MIGWIWNLKHALALLPLRKRTLVATFCWQCALQLCGESVVMLMPASPPFAPALNRGLIPHLVSQAKCELCTDNGAPRFRFSCLPSPPLSRFHCPATTS